MGDAAKRVNQLCEELGIPLRNPGITSTPSQQYQPKQTSQYKGVYWHTQSGKWYAHLRLPTNTGQKKFGGAFNDEMDAAKRVNQLCEESGIPLRNPGISSIPNQQYQAKEKTSQYTGVYWHMKSGKWYAHLCLPTNTGQKKFGGAFHDEMDAAKRVNQLCEELGIPLRNPGISAIPNQQYQPHENTSQYNSVCWNKQHKRWCVKVSTGQGNKIYGGIFKNELDAAKRVNQICQEHGIPSKNPRIETYVVLNENNKNQTIAEGAHPVNGSGIPKNDDHDDGGNEKKRKRKKEFINDENFLVEDYYFYDNLLK